MSGQILHWKHLSGGAFKALDRDNTIVTVSVSPLEVHGPHLPTMTDNVEAEALLDGAMRKFLDIHPNLVVLKLPPVFAGTDVLPHHGSIAMRCSTLLRVVEDLARSLARQGFRHIWMSNFHAGPRHIVALETGCDRVNRRFGSKAISVFSLIVSELARRGRTVSDLLAGIDGLDPKDLEGDSHGGVLETSLLLHLAGDYVKAGYERLPRVVEPVLPAKLPGVVRVAMGLRNSMLHYQKNTYCGAPGRASAAIGQEILARFADFTASVLDEMWTGQLTPEHARTPLWKVRGLFLSERLGGLVERVLGYDPAVI